MLRKKRLGCLSRRFVGCQENDVVGLSSVEQLCSKPNERGIRFLDTVFVAVGLVGDELARFVHHRRHEWIGVVELVGNDDPALLESIRVGNAPRGILVRCGITAKFFIDALRDTHRDTCLPEYSTKLLKFVFVRTATSDEDAGIGNIDRRHAAA
jgi:hypothetical protein